MGALSTRSKATASRLLTAYGQSVTFSRNTTTEYNTATGSVEPLTTTSFTAVGQPTSYRLDQIDGQTIQQNDIRLVVYTVTEPLIEDIASIDSVDYRVMNIEKVNAQGGAIVYRLQLRK